jgi:hypothetical protein
MALHQLPFGYVDWPQHDPAPAHAALTDAPARERLIVTVPAGLRRHVEESAALAGVPTETWIARSLARSVDPRLLGA